ncbi:MAG: hypothetical protein ACR2L6_07715 [Gemmatimonadaceae bacterium]
MIHRFAPSLRIQVAALLLLSVGCSGGASLTDPDAEATASPPPFPALSRPGHIYNEAAQLYRDTFSRYVLYDDGGFALQFSRSGEYLGRYTIVVSGADTSLVFAFAGNASWAATAPWGGNVLAISYNDNARWDDFKSGTYHRVQTP